MPWWLRIELRLMPDWGRADYADAAYIDLITDKKIF